MWFKFRYRNVGLNIDDNAEKRRKKEQKWVSNFQKHAFLSESGDHDIDKAKTTKSGSYSPGKAKSSSGSGSQGGATFRLDKRKGGGSDGDEPSRNTRSKCSDPNISAEDLLMLGMYRLSAEQEEVYRRFVEMVSTFDEFDKVNLVESSASGLYFTLALTRFGSLLGEYYKRRDEGLPRGGGPAGGVRWNRAPRSSISRTHTARRKSRQHGAGRSPRYLAAFAAPSCHHFIERKN